VMAKAANVGHAAYADRATVEMQLGDQTPSYIAGWVEHAHKELDALEPADADVVIPGQDELPL